MRRQFFISLVDKYLSGKADHAERQLIEAYLERLDRESGIIPAGNPEEREEKLWNRISGAIDGDGPAQPARRVHFIRRWGWVAASVVFLLGLLVYLRMNNQKALQPAPAVAAVEDIIPGREGAILTLADGTQVVLDSLGNGPIALQNGSQVALQGGRLAYRPAGAAAGEVMYNTLTTPKGRQFEVVLPDGTKVWLNAASSLTYPTVFDKKTREVSVTGEVYFEVEHDPSAPFMVAVRDETRVEVMGTHFNINAYTNENTVRTTLLEGRVKISRHTEEQLLYPGYQAVVAENIAIEPVKDVEQVVAWKNGLFNFDNSDLPTIMRQFERWYDIAVQYEGEVPVFDFQGKLPRNLHLSQVLRVLSQMGVQARLEERTLIISP